MMFTKEQGQELMNLDNTVSEWTSLNGVSGRKFLNKTDSSKYIFLPAGGAWYDTEHRVIGYLGYSWSTSISTSLSPFNESQSWLIAIRSDNYVATSDSIKWPGFTIRPITLP